MKLYQGLITQMNKTDSYYIHNKYVQTLYYETEEGV